MKRRWHELFGMAIFTFLYVPLIYAFHFTYLQIALRQNPQVFDPLYWSMIFLAGFCALYGSVFPDFLDRPRNRNHRKGAHSRKLLKWMGGSILIGTVITIVFPAFMFVPGFAVGHLSHLIADASTPMGLPS